MAFQPNSTVKVLDPIRENYDNYLLIDVGSNMVNKKFSRDLESVLQRAKDSGVQKIIVPCTSLRTSKEALRLARIYPGALYSTAGIHPHEAKSWEDNYYDELRDIAKNPECVAIGICGLDYNKDFSSPDIQRKVFELQISLAKEIKKPIMLHQKEHMKIF
uniref:Deoxyribonuclease TATDN1 n=1 Tax=Acyrthosiphon pisum TaxID=7029 RepID=C4WV51_ACYPI|nr:ACYPI002802 [Acyrthosiphon pisum]